MTIYTDAYNTHIGSMEPTKDVDLKIREAFIKDGIFKNNLHVNTQGETKPVFITGVSQSESAIPLFTHPIRIKNFESTDYLCTDMRLFLRQQSDILDIENSIRNRTEYNFAKSRAVINLVWLNGGSRQIKNTLKFAANVYASWLSENITRTYSLDFRDQNTLTVIAYAFYYSLFEDLKGNRLSDDDKQKIAIQIPIAFNIPSEFVFETLDKITTLSTAEDFCKNVKDILVNVRLKDFSLLMLLTIIRNSWYGVNAKNIISVAVEHPPTWVAIVFTVLNEKTYKRSNIYNIAERLGKRGKADEFLASYEGLVRDNLSLESETLIIRDFE
jgi:hypothetical protein